MMLKNIFKRELHIYQKIIILFLALLGPIYLISLRINSMGSTYIQKEISNSVMLNVKYYSKHLNNQFESVKNQQLYFVKNDSDLEKLNNLYGSVLDNYDDVKYIKNISERLAVIRYSSELLKNTGVLLKSINKTISFEKSVNDIPNPESSLIFKYLADSRSETSLYHEGGRLFMLELYPTEAKTNPQKAQIISYLEFDLKSIKESIKQLIITENSSAVLVDKNFDIIVDTQEGSSIAKSFDKTVLMKRIENNPIDELVTSINGKNYWMTYSKLSLPNMILISFIPTSEITGPLYNYNIWFIILSLMSLVVVFVFSFLINYMIHRPMNKFVKAFQELEADNLDVSIKHKKNDEFGYLYRSFNNTVSKLKRSIQQNYEQRIALHQSELKQLQAQINPHFLYNSFFNIYRMCKCGDYDNVARLTQKLGSYYQFVTRSGADEVPLSMEFRHAQDYMEIQSIRFSNRVKVNTVEVPEPLRNLMVPRIILQPVVENCFEHAFENRVGGGSIWIDIGFENNRLCITVDDDGDPVDEEKLAELKEKLEGSADAGEKTGIVNVSRRLRMKYGEESGLTIERSSRGGVRVSIVISYQGGTSNVQAIDCR